MDRDGSPFKRRKYERVPVEVDWGSFQPLLGAILIWPNHETSSIYDISYSGMALVRPALLSFEKNQTIQVQVSFGEKPPVSFKVIVQWANEQVLGVKFTALGLSEHEALDDFLEDRLIGRHMRKIDPKFFGKGVDFSVWYHGPRETNFYLWQEKGQVTRAEFELDRQTLIYENGQLLRGGKLSQEQEQKDLELEDLFLETSQEAPLVRRVIEVLSQIDEPRGPMKELLKILVKS